MNTADKRIKVEDLEHIKNIFGSFDENVKIIEDALDVSIFLRDGEIIINGEDLNSQRASVVIKRLHEMLIEGELITTQSVNYLLSLAEEDKFNKIDQFTNDYICLSSRGRKIKSKTHGQNDYIEAVKNNDVVFSIGPAGTGKTFLAVVMAVLALRNKQVNRIILTRPAVEAGEKLGFLPGDLQNKVDPYLRPLYDALFELMGPDSYQKHLEKGIIEVVPLAYMRGRTLDDSFIILDEAQNTTPQQMKMFMTRIGFGSKVVVTGDLTQIDLPVDKPSGLMEATRVLKDINGIKFIYLSKKDVVRHELVKKIIDAYEKHGQIVRQY